MPLFIISIEYKAPLSQIDEQLEAHKAFLKACYADNVFIASGRKEPRTGGIILARATNKQSLLQILAKDPFKQSDLADYEITEFTPTMYSESFQPVMQDDLVIARSP